MIKVLHVCANVAILLAAGLVVFQVYRGGGTNAGMINGVKPGAHLALPGVTWSGNLRTVLLVLSPECHFCTESAPFYRRLTSATALEGHFRFIAVLPSAVEESKQYLNALNVPVDEIRQFDFALWGLAGTPTIILLDQDGNVQASWAGKLRANEEDQLMAELSRTVKAHTAKVWLRITNDSFATSNWYSCSYTNGTPHQS